ncbi:hypothetical protein ACE103_08160 [Bradyrhizobium sp. ma5]|uniref:hypothetical protein n=1 Tax=Bradyrhizobium sp. ma5 TaxID=3344828 RepID=UPI0035D40A5E
MVMPVLGGLKDELPLLSAEISPFFIAAIPVRRMLCGQRNSRRASSMSHGE